MATIYLADEYRRDFERHYAGWQRDRGVNIYAMPPEGRLADGRLAYHMVPDEFLDVLRRARVPFATDKT
jgi:hypothetical protein